MPRFLFPEAEELNPLLGVKRKVIKALKAQYHGVESTVGQEVNLEEKFNRVYQSMIRLTALLGEIDNSLKLNTLNTDGLVSSVSNATMEVANLLLFLSQEVPTLQIFKTNQIETITGLNNNLVAVVQEIDQLSQNAKFKKGGKTLSRFREVVSPLVRDVATLQQKLEGINTPAGVGSLTSFGKDMYDEDKTPSAQPQMPSGFDDNNDVDFDMDTDDDYSEVKMNTDRPPRKEKGEKRERESDFEREKKRVKREEDMDELDIPSVPPSPFPSAPEPSRRRDKRKRDGDGEVSESKRSRPNPKSRKRSRDADDEGNARKRFRENEPFDEIPEPSIARPNKRQAKNQLKRPNKKQDIGKLEDDIPDSAFHTPPRPSRRRSQKNKEEEMEFHTPQGRRPTRNRRPPQRFDPVEGRGYGGAFTQSRFL